MNNLLMAQQGGGKASIPPTIGGFRVSQVWGNNIIVAWDTYTFPEGFGRFEVYIDGAIWDTLYYQTYTDYLWGDFTPDQTYEIYLKAIDTKGQFCVSETVSATAVENTPPSLNYFYITQEMGGLRVNLSASDSPGVWWARLTFSLPDDPGNRNYGFADQIIGSGPFSWLIPWGTNLWGTVQEGHCYYFQAFVRDYNCNDVYFDADWIP